MVDGSLIIPTSTSTVRQIRLHGPIEEPTRSRLFEIVRQPITVELRDSEGRRLLQAGAMAVSVMYEDTGPLLNVDMDVVIAVDPPELPPLPGPNRFIAGLSKNRKKNRDLQQKNVELRNKEILERLRQGELPREVGPDYGLGPSGVRKIRAKAIKRGEF